jgi:hypothetical protein
MEIRSGKERRMVALNLSERPERAHLLAGWPPGITEGAGSPVSDPVVRFRFFLMAEA